ncbi:MAG: carboxypeptidase-like regulatory domain-containing protein [Bacteroidales bacterium]
MTRPFILLMALMITGTLGSQDLAKSRTTSPYTYIFSLTEKQSLDLIRKGSTGKDEKLFSTVVDSFPTGKAYNGKLQPGNYVTAYVDNDRVRVLYSSEPNVHLAVVDNKTDLIIQVRDTSGHLVEDATLKMGARTIRWDQASMAYRLAKSNIRGILTVSHDGVSSLFSLDRTLDNSSLRRNSRKLAYNTPVRYVWVPVKTVVLLPYDAVRSAIRGYGFGTARGVWWNIKRAIEPGPYSGFMLFNKPKYMPGDTVMLKAWVLTGKNKKPFQGETDLKIYLTDPYRQVKLATLAPYVPGGYTHSFVLADTLGLRLDKDYSITMTPANRSRALVSGSFLYEYYDLRSLKLVVRTPDSVQYRGRPFIIGLKALNENEMILPDARVTLHILRERVNEISGPFLPVKDTIAVIRENLRPSGETVVMIPDSLFPEANMICKIVAVANTSDNESVTETRTMTFIDRKEEICYSTRGDSIQFFLKVNGTKTEREAELIVSDAFGNKKPALKISLPWQMKIDPFVTGYSVVSGNARRTVAASELSHGVAPRTSRTSDSVFISVASNTGLSFSYFIYDFNREVARGTAESLEFSERVTTDRKWYLSLSYLWGGEMNNSIYEISRDISRLNISAEQPDKIIPGKETAITLTVTDADGRPVRNTDVTAFSLTRKFGFNLPALPNLAKPGKSKEHINSFRTSPPNSPYLNHPLAYNWWNAKAGLDTVEYFRFRYHPEEVAIFKCDMGDSITQFAPFIFRDGQPVRINQVSVDHRPVYIDFASANQPYSFRVDTGYHFISLRTPEAVYEADSVWFERGRKLVLSIRDTDNPEAYFKKDASPKMKASEQRRIANYVMPYRTLFENSVAFLRQDSNVLLMSDVSQQLANPDRQFSSRGTRMVGPVMPTNARFVLPGKFTTNFSFEPLYEYDFEKGLMRMRSFDPVKRIPLYYSKGNTMQDWRSSVLTPAYIERVSREITEKRTAPRYRYSRSERTLPGNGTVHILDSRPEKVASPVVNFLASTAGRAVYDRQGNDKVLTNIQPGIYRFISFMPGGNHLIIDSVEVRSNSGTFIDLSWADTSDDPELYRKIIEMINAPVSSPGTPSSLERQLMQEFTRQDVNAYDGPGFTVSGVVTSLSDNERLPGVTVYCQENGFGTTTDIDGRYSIRLPFGNHRLSFMFIGMKSFETEVSYENQLDVTLEEELLAMDEVVVVGYGISRKENLSASVVTVNALQGRMAGVQVSEDQVFMIRGFSSVDAEPPLIIIDGVPWSGDMSLIDPELLKSMTVIKDPAMTALYGSRAAGGVIMLTMKPGGVIAAAAESDPLVDEQFLEEAMAAGTLRRNFRDYGYWKPDLRTDDSGKVTFTVKFPDDITSWETYAVAVNGNRQAGSAKGNIRAFMPVTGLLSAPHYVVEGDSLNLIGRIMNHTGAPMSLTERFINNTDTLINRQRDLAEAIVDTLPVIADGADSLRLEYSFTTETGLKDGEFRPIPVLRAGMEVDSGMVAFIEKDSSLTVDLSRWPGEVSLTAVAGLKDIMLTASHRLIKYLYGCNEQMASRLAGYLSAVETDRHLGKVSRGDEREIRSLIGKLLDNRNKDGLWGWWGRSETEDWISQHVIRTLLRAGKLGYTVNIGISGITDFAVLALEKNPDPATALSLLEILSDIGAKADYNRYLNIISDTCCLSLTDSIRIAGIRQRNKMPADLSFLEKAKRETVLGGVYFTNVSERWDIMKTDMQTTLLAYDLLCRDTLQKIARPEQIRRYFYEYLSMKSPLNTYQTASVLNALAFYPEPERKNQDRARMIITSATDTVVDSFPYTIALKDENQPVTLINDSDMPLFLGLGSKLFIADPEEDTTDFRVTTRLSGPANQMGSAAPGRPAVEEVKSGMPVTLTADVEFFKSADYVVIEIPVPSGFAYNEKKGYWPGEVHREFYRDHVAIFIRHATPGIRTFEISLMPRFTGRFVMNPAKVSLMYFPVIYSNNELKRVIIN